MVTHKLTELEGECGVPDVKCHTPNQDVLALRL